MKQVSKKRLFIEELERPGPAEGGMSTTAMKGEECSLPPAVCEHIASKRDKML